MGADLVSDVVGQARMLQRYAKQYSAGAFATPSAKDLTVADVRSWPGAVAVVARTGGGRQRKDFTGAPYSLAPGSSVVTHLAVEGEVPDLGAFDYVYAYREHQELHAALVAQGRVVRAVRISAASEMIACYARAGEGRSYQPWDQATLLRVPFEAAELPAAVGELAGIDEWFDDYPFYNKDGSWSAVSLRGFSPDPTWGVKPAEMSRDWWRRHPEQTWWKRADWTTLADRCPRLAGLAGSIAGGRPMERVRLLRMSGRGGAGGVLLRHCDVTDRAAGTRDGQIARLHFPLVTDPRIVMVAWDLDGQRIERHLEEGGLYYLDQRKPHMVINGSDVDRVHLVVDVEMDQGLRDVIVAAG